jgi:glutathionylspermidine synthase
VNTISISSTETATLFHVGQNKMNREFHCCPLQTIAKTESELPPEGIAEAQTNDDELKELHNAVKNESTRPSWKSVQSSSDSTRMLWAQYETPCVHQRMLCRKYLKSDGLIKNLQIIMPRNFRERFFQQLHQTGGNTATTHLGVRKTQMHVQQRAYWPGWKRDVDRFCHKCAVCHCAVRSSST